MFIVNQNTLNDPTTKYPRPPYGDNTQPKPGVTTEMYPRPDHGEESYRGHNRLQGLVALVTGGDSGIGRAVALAYAREGADIAFTYFSKAEQKDADETESLIKRAGRKVITYQIDQSQPKECARVVQDVLENFKRLDILVNNAAFQDTYESIGDIPDDQLDYMFKLNVESYYHFSREALKFLPPGGSIINTTSIQSYKPSIKLSPYAATKAAITNFTKSLAAEAIKHGVRVNAVAPGPVWTPLIPSSMAPNEVEHFGEHSLFGRAAQPAELAPVYVFLASDEASFISGEVYGVTGGEKQV